MTLRSNDKKTRSNENCLWAKSPRDMTLRSNVKKIRSNENCLWAKFPGDMTLRSNDKKTRSNDKIEKGSSLLSESKTYLLSSDLDLCLGLRQPETPQTRNETNKTFQTLSNKHLFSLPLAVLELTEDGGFKKTVLGSDIAAGHQLQYTVPPNVWFGSYPTMDVETCSSDGKLLAKSPSRDAESHFSLVGCTCAPAFQFEDFELAKRADLLAFAPKAEALVFFLTFPD
ncbi:hypothetical protein GIB67_034233 [Kingdonia uniflora]|uniref:DUF985 domain-containing protein n=1 Tax=Kingdonia uniflora TaxID=39325 RepID=A0A7J7NRK7_9MAGN|nr:hypothetical protein GIB67_034233 [Kingdonia uniflora]